MNTMKWCIDAIVADPNIRPELRAMYSMASKPPQVSHAITEFAMQDAHQMRTALQAILALNPVATGEDYTTLGEAQCFQLAQAIAKAALAGEPK